MSEIRAALESAFDGTDGEEDTQDSIDAVTETQDPEPKEDAPEPTQEEPPGKVTGEADPDKAPATQEPSAGKPKSDEPAPPSTPSTKAPVDWNPEEREQWSKVPPSIQAKIAEREREVNTILAESRQARETHNTFREIQQTYGAIMAAEGVKDPMQAVKGMFDAVSTLRMGSATDKAAMIARFIQGYNVDIDTLDRLLANEPVSEKVGMEDQIRRMLDERLRPMEDSFRQNQTHHTQQSQAQIGQEIQSFAQSHEFFNDVREDMADLIDMAVKRGQEMTLEEAYNKAVAINPSVANVISSRQQAALDAKKSASQSLRGRQTSDIDPGSQSTDIRSILEQAWLGDD